MSRRRPLAALVLVGLALALPVSPVAAEGPAPGSNLEAPTPRYEGTDPNRNPLGYRPFQIVKYPRSLDPRLRGIKVMPGQIELVEGGQLVGRIPFVASAFSPANFEDLAKAVGDPEWVAEVEPGVFGLRAAVVLAPGSAVRFVGPGTRELRLATNPPGVFLGGYGTTTLGVIDGVKVTSWDLNLRRPSDDITIARPFVAFEDGARLDINRSELSHLGSDRVGAYGVAWRRGGATGNVTGSVFSHNFFGVYTYEARGIHFANNVFRDNIFYGVDPHDSSYGLVVEDNEAFGNGSHGIIFSRDVSDSSIRRNYSHDNQGNGIVLDADSNRNLVEHNNVENNHGDGIVLLGSSGNVVADNQVRGNRVGIRANKAGSANIVRRNLIDRSEIGVQAYGGATALELSSNIVTGSVKAGYVLDAPRTTVKGGRVTGGQRGFDVRAPASLVGVLVKGVHEGVRVRPSGVADISGLAIESEKAGVRVEPGGRATLGESTLRSSPPTLGTVLVAAGNDFVEPAESGKGLWLALAGVAALECAVLLELVQHLRERRHGYHRRRARRLRRPGPNSPPEVPMKLVTWPDQDDADEQPDPPNDPATTRRFAIVSVVVAVVLIALIAGAVLRSGSRAEPPASRRSSLPAGDRLPAVASGQVLMVSAAAAVDDREGDGSRARPFSSISEALAVARPGDTVAVGPGTYDGFRTVRSGDPDVPIRLLGTAAVIKGDGDGHLVEVRHDHVTLEGFEMARADIVIYVFNATGVRIVNNVIRDARGECVRIKYRSVRNEVVGNRIERCGGDFDASEGEKNGEGVYIGTSSEQLDRNPTNEPDASDSNWVHENVITTPAECVDIKEGASANIIEANHCRGGQDPDGAGFSSRGSGNTFRDNVSEGHKGSGLRLGGHGDEDGIDNVVVDNHFLDNDGYGIKVQRQPQRDICGNDVRGNKEGPRNDDAPDPTAAC